MKTTDKETTDEETEKLRDNDGKPVTGAPKDGARLLGTHVAAKTSRATDTPSVPERFVSFADLVAAGIINNWQTLAEWQKNPEIAFPLGRLFGPNSRRWSWENEIVPWLETRPLGGKANPRKKRTNTERSTEPNEEAAA